MWGKAGQRSLARSALVEAAEQLTRALAQIATLPATPALRREQIKLQVALITPLMHVKGYAAPETKAAAERARLLIEQAEALGEPPEDPLLLFSVLYGFVVANLAAFNGDVMSRACRRSSWRSLRSKERRLRFCSGIVSWALPCCNRRHRESKAHLDQGIALYDPLEHRPLATRFGQDARVTICSSGLRLCGCLAIPRPRWRTPARA